MPHHITQRGNRRSDVFFSDEDRQKYLGLVLEYGGKYEVAIWAYCLMTNHVHFIAVPATAGALALTFRDAHQAYASWLNRKMGESGHLWQAVRHVERNPVRAKQVPRAEDWAWSSAAAHCGLREDPLLSPIDMPWPVANWSEYLRDEDEDDVERVRGNTRTGRPLGCASFLQTLEALLGRSLVPGKRGRKPKRGTG
jgi:REP-associated tyrosine transposase